MYSARLTPSATQRFSRRWSDLLLVVLTLAAFALVLAAGRSPATIEQPTRAEAERVYQASEQLVQVATHLAQERGLVYLALYADDAITAQIREAILAQRQQAADAYQTTMQLLRDKLELKIFWPYGLNSQTTQSLDFFRQSIDEQLTRARPERDTRMAHSWFNQTTETIDSIDRLLGLVHYQLLRYDTALRPALDLQRFAFKASELVGRERALFSAAAAGATLSARQLAQVQRDRRRLANYWSQAEAALRRDAPDTQLLSALTMAKTALFVDYQAISTGMLNAAALALDVSDTPAGAVYPLAPLDWFEQASQTVDSLLTLATTAGNHAWVTLTTKFAATQAAL